MHFKLNNYCTLTLLGSLTLIYISIGKCNTILTHSHTMTPFDALGNKPFENTVGKGEIARNEQFLLFPQCFLTVWIAFCHFRLVPSIFSFSHNVFNSLLFYGY